MALASWFRELGLCIKAILAQKHPNRLSTKKKKRLREFWNLEKPKTCLERDCYQLDSDFMAPCCSFLKKADDLVFMAIIHPCWSFWSLAFFFLDMLHVRDPCSFCYWGNTAFLFLSILGCISSSFLHLFIYSFGCNHSLSFGLLLWCISILLFGWFHSSMKCFLKKNLQNWRHVLQYLRGKQNSWERLWILSLEYDQKLHKQGGNITYSMVVGVATNSCLRCQTAPVAYGIATSPKYLYWGRREDMTM